MAYYYTNVWSAAVLGFFILFIVSRVTFSEAQKVPGIYVFGDSLVDVGNNNYFTTVVRVNHPHNGIDFPDHKPTGRFSNGKVTADFLAEKVGLPTSPPYLSLTNMLNKNNASFLSGISFASGAAGILDITNKDLAISMNKQVKYYTTSVYEEVVQQLGASEALNHLSKSLFYIVIGNNDIMKYFDRLPVTQQPQEFVDSMILTLKQQLKQLYNYGGRKFVIAGSGPIGCIPLQRHKNNKTLECKQDVNSACLMYNEGLKSMSQELKSELKDINYSYFDTYNFFSNLIQKPVSYGFAEVKVACCGVVDAIDVKHLCRRTSSYCSDRSNYLFWDPYHPSEAASRIVADAVFDDPLQYSFPFNVEQLIAL
ncbi:hypothetical protein FNV43_RR03873 [Rhamnella rubrinervis]|uniref:GDSL esterase/lipase n=1 Tax=Rhamnella rubrinervis TaxID=2594499 RepID=A0A8K0HKT5_9ROSA|nr:hypothetical protein FNV43_RR03873 [Rhamnella rubrinervis]